MNGTEFKRCREALGLTHRELARVLRLRANGHRDLRRYEDGDRPVPGPVSVVMDMLANDYDPMAERRDARVRAFAESDMEVEPLDTPFLRNCLRD